MLETVVSYLLQIIGHLGYAGIVVLMFLESTFFPFPSEVIIPPAAYLSAKGSMNIYLVILSGISGSLLGALFNYYISRILGIRFLMKYGKFFGISKRVLAKSSRFFKKHGAISTFIGRLLPGIRQYISMPAGVAKMNLFAFCIFTILGAGIWVGILAFIGYAVGDSPQTVKLMIHRSYVYISVFILIITVAYIALRGKYDKRI